MNGGAQMKAWFRNTLSGLQQPAPDSYDYYDAGPAAVPGGGMMGVLQDLGRWDELAAEVAQEGQGRVAIAGLPQSGKRLLLSRLRGWDMAPLWNATAPESSDGIGLESYGSFLLADLTQPADGHAGSGDELLLLLGDPALVLYVIDAGRGLLPADYRWVALLRSGGRPVLVALNNSDDDEASAAVVTEAAGKLGATVIPISAESGFNIEEALLPALVNAVPRLAVPLGREIQSVRTTVARRVIRQSALFAGILGAQPVPLLDLPFQIMVQSGMVMRVGASFGYAPGGGLNREIMATIAGSLALHYLAQTVVKLVPILGWAVSGALAGLSTMAIGEAAIQYYAAGATIPFRQWGVPFRHWLGGPGRRLRQRRNSDVTPVQAAAESADQPAAVVVEERP